MKREKSFSTKRIRQLLLAKSLKDIDLAKLLDVTRQTVSKQLSGEFVSAEFAARVYNAIGVPFTMDTEEVDKPTELTEKGDHYLMEHLARIEQSFARVQETYQGEMKEKNRQIAELQEAVKVLLGKSEGVLHRQNSFQDLWSQESAEMPFFSTFGAQFGAHSESY